MLLQQKIIEDMSRSHKRQNGIFYTANNPFKLVPFKRWAKKVCLTENAILEPFAGANNIIRMLQQENLCNDFRSYDVEPKDKLVEKRDTLYNFPVGYNVCITNPPWLTNYSARRNNIFFPKIEYDNIYKHCLKLALKNCENVCFIIPATYLRTGLFF